jgi:glycosyltransferase involved in cell wall biosynthesis
MMPAQHRPIASGGLTIVIAAVAGSSSLSGVSRHAVNLARCLLTREDIAEVHLIVARWQYAELNALISGTECRLHLHSVKVRRGTIARNVWYYNELPHVARQLGADIIHLAYPAPIRRLAFECPTVVTLHDLYPYDISANFGFPKVIFNRAILQQCLRAADSIVCVSESTLRRLDMYLPELAVQKAMVVYNCVDTSTLPLADCSNAQLFEKPFLLCVAQHRRNKNIPLAIRVFGRLLNSGGLQPDTRLLIVGIPGPETRLLYRQIERARLEQSILLLHGLTDCELQLCYSRCELLLAPSLIEGFGLPIVEAMFHQCPIVCSDIPAHREVGGSYPIYADLHRSPEDSFVEAARVAMADHRFRPVCVERFSSAAVSKEILRLYMRLLLPHETKLQSRSTVSLPLLERGKS